MRKLKIAVTVSEAVPFTEPGEIPDFWGSLAEMLARKGHEVLLLLPRYSEINSAVISPESCTGVLTVPLGFGEKYAAVRRSTSIHGVKTYFIEHNDYFDRKGLYGDSNGIFGDNAERFTFYSRAVLQAITELNFRPDIIHCGGWQTGLVPVFLKTIYAKEFNFFNTRSVMTVHDMRNQGVFPKEDIFFSQLGWEAYNEECLKFYDAINFLKAGLLYCDAITTAGKKYALETTSPEFGYELHGIMQKKKKQLYGIFNGCGGSSLNPSTDKAIEAYYSANNISGKEKCKSALQKTMNIPVKPKIPVICSVTEVTERKGMDQLASVLGNILTANRNFQFILLGNGDSEIIHRYRTMKALYPENIAINEGNDTLLERKVISGSDIFIAPYKCEPSGRSQVIGMKYGTIPIVNAVGGLDDAVTAWDRTNHTGNGFKLYSLETMSLLKTINHVFDEFNDTESWKTLVRNAMLTKDAWKEAVNQYENLFEMLVKNRYSHLME